MKNVLLDDVLKVVLCLVKHNEGVVKRARHEMKHSSAISGKLGVICCDSFLGYG